MAKSMMQLADVMGVTRQGAQKQLNLLLEEELVAQQPNPAHRRSPTYHLTRRGLDVYAATEVVQRLWAAQLARGLSPDSLTTAVDVLRALSAKLQ
jgi:DNA-binding MarR family transcriptional regulator